MKADLQAINVPKWVLIVWLKIPQTPQNLSAQYDCPSPKVLDFNEKWLHWASVVRATAAAALRYLTIEIHIPCEKSVLYFLQ